MYIIGQENLEEPRVLPYRSIANVNESYGVTRMYVMN